MHHPLPRSTAVAELRSAFEKFGGTIEGLRDDATNAEVAYYCEEILKGFAKAREGRAA